MRRLFAAGDWNEGETIVLDAAESRHGGTVLRLRVGDEVGLLNGAGRSGLGLVQCADRGGLSVAVTAASEQAPGPGRSLRMVVAPPKGSRWEDLCRGLAELGVGSVAPLACRWGNREPKRERTQRVVLEACKQSGRAHRMQVCGMVDFTTLAQGSADIILCDPAGGPPLPGPPGPTTIVVGPEAGFSSAEREQLIGLGATPVRLSDAILRIETAALTAAGFWLTSWEHHGDRA